MNLNMRNQSIRLQAEFQVVPKQSSVLDQVDDLYKRNSTCFVVQKKAACVTSQEYQQNWTLRPAKMSLITYTRLGFTLDKDR